MCSYSNQNLMRMIKKWLEIYKLWITTFGSYLQLGEEKIKFIIDLRIDKTNAKERNETGQKRWKIENKVCNEEKSKNGLKHA